MATLEEWELSRFVVSPQVRSSLPTDPHLLSPEQREELLRLGDSLAEKQLQPVGAYQVDGTLYWGYRRLLAAKLRGLKTLLVLAFDKPLADPQLWQLTENLQRSDLSGFEKWQACAEIMRSHPGWAQKELAQHLHLSESMIVRVLSPSRTIPAWQEALRAGTVGISDCYAASKLGAQEQAALLALKLSGASRDAIEKAGRQRRTAAASAVRLARVKIALPDGAAVVVSGRELGMAEIVELLAQSLKEARKAAEQYDVKTFQSMMADKAKGGTA